MAQRQLRVDFVLVAAPVAGLRQVSRLFEVFEDVRRRAFRDPDIGGDVSEPRSGIAGDALEDVRVVCREPPEVVVFPRA